MFAVDKQIAEFVMVLYFFEGDADVSIKSLLEFSEQKHMEIYGARLAEIKQTGRHAFGNTFKAGSPTLLGIPHGNSLHLHKMPKYNHIITLMSVQFSLQTYSIQFH